MLLAFAPVAQLDRALVYGTKGYKFESCQAHFHNPSIGQMVVSAANNLVSRGKNVFGPSGSVLGQLDRFPGIWQSRSSAHGGLHFFYDSYFVAIFLLGAFSAIGPDLHRKRIHFNTLKAHFFEILRSQCQCKNPLYAELSRLLEG